MTGEWCVRGIQIWSCLLSCLCVMVHCKQQCSLYESAVGMTCFHGDEVTMALTNSSTSWVVEFYSSWCGHCQYFAPTWMQLTKEIQGWSSILRVGVIDCSATGNHDACSKFSVFAYPSVKLFNPHDNNPSKYVKEYRNKRAIPELKAALIDHIESLSSRPRHWPSLQPLVSDALLGLPALKWKPTVLVFEDDGSYLGRELILDYASEKAISIVRVSKDNVAMVKHYSTLEFPSMVLEMEKDDYIITAGHSFENPAMEFRKRIDEHLARATPRSKPRGSVSPAVDFVRGREGGDGRRETQPAESWELSRSATRVTRVNASDLMSAVSYALRVEVQIHSIVSGSAFTALLKFVRLLESVFHLVSPAVSANLQPVRIKLETRQSSGFILRRDWNRTLETKLDAKLFPREAKWRSCLGSKPHYRGYPCGLWMLMHTALVLTLPVRGRSSVPPRLGTNSREALAALCDFITNFFSCEYCREHFAEMARSIGGGQLVDYDGDAVLWLWEAHNTVNRRLEKDISSDPAHPKLPFPSREMCPYCYREVSSRKGKGMDGGGGAAASENKEVSWEDTGFADGESLLNPQASHTMGKSVAGHRYVWNRTSVLLFLWNFYHLNKSEPSSSSKILLAAWPKRFNPELHKAYLGMGNGVGFNGYDLSLCFVCYVACAAVLVVGFWVIRKRRLRSWWRLSYP